MSSLQSAKIKLLEEILSNIQADVCSFLCTAVYKTGTPQPHCDKCIAITKALREEES